MAPWTLIVYSPRLVVLEPMDLHPVAARRERRPVDDVVAAVGRVAGRGGDQVAAGVIEVDRRIEIIGELLSAGAGAAGRGRRDDQVVAGVDVELSTSRRCCHPGRRRPGPKREAVEVAADPLNEGKGVRIVFVEEVVAGAGLIRSMSETISRPLA